MSFSKARLQRFNELTTSVAPPPGAYDPKFDNKVRGPVIEKTVSRFNDGKSTSSGAECNGSVSSRTTSNASAKKFRTPQVPKKRIAPKPNGMSCPRIKTKLYNNENRDPQLPYEPQQELADLKVECANKNKTIHEYERYIDEMKNELQQLTDKYGVLQKEYELINELHQKDIEAMANLQQEVMENKSEKYQTEVETLQFQLTEVLKNKEDVVLDKNLIEEDLTRKINSLELELQKQVDYIKEQEENMMISQSVMQKINQDLNEALLEKDEELKEEVKKREESETELRKTQEDLIKSEARVIALEANIENINAENTAQVLTINTQLLDELTAVLQGYFDTDNYNGQWNIDSMTFHPDVEEFLKKIKKCVSDLKVTYEREIELSRDNFNEEREDLEQHLEKKKKIIEELEGKLAETLETNTFLNEELQDVQKLYKDMSRNLHELKAELEVVNEKYNKTLSAHKAELELTSMIHSNEQSQLKDLLEEARSEYLKELDNMTSARNEELAEVKRAMEKRIEDEKKRMKECANKMVENAEAVTRETLKACRAESEERVRRVLAETDAKVNSLVREAKSNSEEELRQATEKYNAHLDKLESEKAALNVKLAQKDIELIRLTAGLEEMKCTVETQESFSQSLQAELDRAEAELVEKKEELRNLKDQIRTESAEMVARRKRFEVVMAENQLSVAALTRRLEQSEAEVERLQREVAAKEGSLMGYRDLFETITHNSKMVQEQLDSITDKLDEKVDMINQIEEKNMCEINDAKATFNAKIEHLKISAIDELAKVQMECKLKLEKNAELKNSLLQMSERLKDATSMLLKMEEINDEQSIELSKLQLQNSKLQQQLDEKNKLLEESKVSFDKQTEVHKSEISDLKAKSSKLQKEVKLLEEKIVEFEEKKYNCEELKIKYDDQVSTLTKMLESEKSQRESLDRQIKQYEESCQRLTNECKQVTDKYSELASQGNSKQRVKHVSQLKEKINVQQMDLQRLRQELDTKSDLVDELKQANESLRLGELRQLGQGKENLPVSVSSPSAHKLFLPKSTATTPVSSPHKPLTPLRDRND